MLGTGSDGKITQWRKAGHAVQWNEEDGKNGGLLRNHLRSTCRLVYMDHIEILARWQRKRSCTESGPCNGPSRPPRLVVHLFLRHKMECKMSGTAHAMLLLLAGQAECVHSQRNTSSFVIPLEYIFSIYIPLINWSDKIAVLTRYKYTQVGSDQGNGRQELVPLCYACIYWLGYDLATVASRTTTGTVTQIRQTPCRH